MAIINGSGGDDVIFGTSVSDTINGNGGNDNISGLAGNDTITTGAGNDIIDGGTGADMLTGGDGNDTYFVDNAQDKVIEAANVGSGLDTIETTVSYTLPDNVEYLTLIGSAGIAGTGNALDNIITGNTANNVLKGLAGNDILDGGAGADLMYGGTGDDTYQVDNTKDRVFENPGEGTDTIFAKVNYILPANVENLTLTGIVATTATGNTDVNVITGNDADNTLNGGGGADTLVGGFGNDTYIVNNPGVNIIENAGPQDGSADTVRASISWDLNGSPNVENLVLTGSAPITGTGNGLDNIIDGSQDKAANVLDGQLGNDTYILGVGDTIAVDSGGTDTVQVAFSYDISARLDLENITLTGTGAINATGNANANVLTGNSGINILTGGAGDDTLIGGAGADTMIGGTGNDTYYVDNTGDVVRENAGEGADVVFSSVSYNLGNAAMAGSEIDALTLTGAANLNATGNGFNNTITGNTGNNTLDGGAGADTLIGGGGTDTYIVDNTGDVVTGNGGNDVIKSSVTWDLSVNSSGVNHVILTGTVATNATANGSGDILDGTQDSAANTLTGGAGNDTFIIGANDVVATDPGGTNTVEAAFSYDISGRPDLQNITLLGTGAFDATGNSGNNILTGNAGVNTFDGQGGNDTYVVTPGDVILPDANLSDNNSVIADFSYSVASRLDLDNITLTGTGNFSATGNTNVNILTGNAGNNLLDGHAGADTMIGGAGNDTFIVDNVNDVVVETSGGSTDMGGIDLVKSSVSYTLTDAHVENLTLTGTAAINGTGNALENIITGNSADNILDGGTGADTMIGGAGNDTYMVDNSGDVVTDTSGVDLIIASASYTLPLSIENLVLTGSSNIIGMGNALANSITDEGTGNNTLNGGGGADTMFGGFGNDTYVVDNVHDVILDPGVSLTNLVEATISYTLPANVHNLLLEDFVPTGGTTVVPLNGTGNELDNIIQGNSAINTLTGADGNDTLLGLGGNDVLQGGFGNDTLDGGDGADIMFGGPGADVFYFELATALHNIDQVRDFNTGEGDKIDIHELLTAYVAGTDNITDFVKITTSGTNSILSVDTDGTGTAAHFTEIAILNNSTGLNDVASLVANGNLIV